MKKTEIAFLFPLHNEADRVIKIRKFETFAKKNFKKFKLIFLLNNCTDDTELIILQNFKKEIIQIIHSGSKHRGSGLNLAFKKIKCDFFAVCAVDNAWSFDFYSKAHKILKSNNEIEIVYGPKSHPKSIVNRSKIRSIISAISVIFFKIFFDKHVNFDCQCIKMFRSNLKFLKKLNNFNYFAETEFAIMASIQKTCVEMIPVKIKNTKGSKVNIMNLIKYVIEAFKFRFLYLK
jgi:hypothetical protein